MRIYLKEKKQDEDNGGRRGIGGAGLPLAVDAADEVVDAEKEAVVRYQTDVQGEKDEKLLVLFSDAVVDPRTVVVHFSDAPVQKIFCLIVRQTVLQFCSPLTD